MGDIEGPWDVYGEGPGVGAGGSGEGALLDGFIRYVEGLNRIRRRHRSDRIIRKGTPMKVTSPLPSYPPEPVANPQGKKGTSALSALLEMEQNQKSLEEQQQSKPPAVTPDPPVVSVAPSYVDSPRKDSAFILDFIRSPRSSNIHHSQEFVSTVEQLFPYCTIVLNEARPVLGLSQRLAVHLPSVHLSSAGLTTGGQELHTALRGMDTCDVILETDLRSSALTELLLEHQRNIYVISKQL